MRLKAIRGYAAVAVALIATAGCETDGETVPSRTAGPLPAATAEPRPLLIAAADAPPVKLDKPAAAAEVSTNVSTPALTTPEATAKAAAEVGVTNVTLAATTNAPAITEEIPPSRPANLKISESTEKVLKLVESNLDEKVVLTFVEQTPAKFELDADEIVYLSDVGVPSTVIAAMLKHDGDDPTKADTLTNVANTEGVQPAIPANTNLPPAIAQTLPGAPQQPIEVTTNYVPNQQVVVQQPETVVVQQPPTVVYAQPETVTYFYDSLSPYGSWFYVSDYGWCWQPTVAVIDHGWRPYGPRGNWVWTDAGWYWRSDYTWGWAPFHYGRWHHHGGRGWMWIPDRTWGPAWVTWRSSGDYCGWAPLPPHAVYSPGFGFSYFGRGVDISFGFGLGYDAFCFAPVSRFHHRRVYDYCLPRHETHRVYSHSRVANRWEFNRGGHDFVNRAGARVETGARPAVVRTMSDNDRSRWGNREHVVERGNREAVIYRPPSPSSSTGSANFARDSRNGSGGRDGSPTWSPRTRAEVATRPSTATGIAASAGQPNIIDSRRGERERGSSDRVEGRPGVISRPSDLAGTPAPNAAGQARVINPATRGDRRQVTGLPAPSTSVPAPVTTLPAPVTGSQPITSTPAPSLSTPGIGNTANTASRISVPQSTPPPAVSRPANPAGTGRILDPATRRPLADAAPATTPVPQTPSVTIPQRSVTPPQPATTRGEFGRQISTPTAPAPAPTTITPRTVAPAPQTISPPPQTVTPSPRIISPPPSSALPGRTISPPVSAPPPTRISPSAPTYSAPAYTPPMRGNISSSPGPIRPPAAAAPAPSAPVSRAPVIQSPSSRGGGGSPPPSRAPAPNNIPANRGRGRGGE